MKTFTIYDTKLEKEVNIYLGQNAQDNWEIIDKANQYDIWFHVQDFSSSHVILQLPESKAKINKQTLYYCANLCKQNSKSKELNKVNIIYTKIKNITKGEKTGSVYTKKVNKIVV
jgi:predicted ribosome quality control (RQC) complex YloA/Tae2 family protein